MNPGDIFDRLRREYEGLPVVEGALEILPEGIAFLNSAAGRIYVGPHLLRRHGLKTGDVLRGRMREAKEGEHSATLLRVLAVNGRQLDSAPGFPYSESR